MRRPQPHVIHHQELKSGFHNVHLHLHLHLRDAIHRVDYEQRDLRSVALSLVCGAMQCTGLSP